MWMIRVKKKVPFDDRCLECSNDQVSIDRWKQGYSIRWFRRYILSSQSVHLPGKDAEEAERGKYRVQSVKFWRAEWLKIFEGFEMIIFLFLGKFDREEGGIGSELFRSNLCTDSVRGRGIIFFRVETASTVFGNVKLRTNWCDFHFATSGCLKVVGENYREMSV